MVAGRPEREKPRTALRFIAFVTGEAILIAVFVALTRSPEHSFAGYAKLIAVEAAAVAVALATEYRRAS